MKVRRAWVVAALMGVSVGLSTTAGLAATAASAGATTVTWMTGFRAPGTPYRYDRVGVLRVGPRRARNVLVLEPGTSAGSAYFLPLAQWIVSHARGWQVWAVERRENLLEDQSELDLVKTGKATAQQLFAYYFGPSADRHFTPIPTQSVAFARQWGMNVAVQDLRRVILAARKLGGKVVLGGHSLGGAVVTAYATWNFGGRPGAADLAGLLYIDGSSFSAIGANTATQQLAALRAGSPWLAFGGIPAPYAGLFSSVGSELALVDPNGQSLLQKAGLLPPALAPPVPATNLAQFGYALNVATSPKSLLAAQAHLGRGLAAAGPIHGWDGAGALTPITRFARMFAGTGVTGADGSEWYFPARLTLDSGAVDNGKANPAQRVLDVHATMGRRLPRRLLIYAFAARLGGVAVLAQTRQLARESHIPSTHLTLINRQGTYAHNDPAGAYPTNTFFAHLIPWLREVAGR